MVPDDMKRLIWLFLIGMAFAQADGPGGATNGTVPNKCGRGTNPCTVANALNVAGQITATGGFLSTGLTLNGAGTPNSSSGTSNGLLAKLVNNGGVVQIQTLGTSDTTSYPLLVVAQRNTSTNAINGCTSACTTGNAYVAPVGGVAACTFDNTAVVGDYVIDGTTGQCHDTGSATAPTSGTFVGRARTAGTGSQSVSIESQVAGGAGGGTSFTVSGGVTVIAGLSPIASTTYYFGQGVTALSTTDDRKNYVVSVGGTVTKFCVGVKVGGTLASAGTVTASLRKNSTTDYGTTVTPDLTTALGASVCTSASTMALSDGDFLSLKIVTPAWVTAPTGVMFFWTAYVTVP